MLIRNSRIGSGFVLWLCVCHGVLANQGPVGHWTSDQSLIDELLAQVAGQKRSVALTYLSEQLPLRDYPELHVWPDWFGRVPYLPVPIQTQIETGS